MTGRRMTIANRELLHCSIVHTLVFLLVALMCGAILADPESNRSGVPLYDSLRIDFNKETPIDVFDRVVRLGRRGLSLADVFAPQGWCTEKDIDFLFLHLDSCVTAPFIESSLSSCGAVLNGGPPSTVGAVAAYFLEWCRSGGAAPMLATAADDDGLLEAKATALKAWRCSTSGKECSEKNETRK